jgi:hypothetical protein
MRKMTRDFSLMNMEERKSFRMMSRKTSNILQSILPSPMKPLLSRFDSDFKRPTKDFDEIDVASDKLNGSPYSKRFRGGSKLRSISDHI